MTCDSIIADLDNVDSAVPLLLQGTSSGHCNDYVWEIYKIIVDFTIVAFAISSTCDKRRLIATVEIRESDTNSPSTSKRKVIAFSLSKYGDILKTNYLLIHLVMVSND
jgi:hypothetical protein